MGWPPSASSTTYTSRGTAITTLAWGTDGLLTDSGGADNSVILKSIRLSEMVEEVKIENGTGLTAMLVGLRDGDQVELTVEDDRSVTFPSFMGIVYVRNPRGTTGTFTNQTVAFQVISNDWNSARKQNGERVILAKKYTLITPA